MIWALIAIIIVWLTVVSVVVFRINRHYKRLVNIKSRKNLEELMEELLDRIDKDRVNIANLKDILNKVIKENEYHIQKIGLVKFNPFPDTGGEQSFSLSLLDQQDNGVVISSLHGRAVTRWYAKNVVKGQGVGIELSKEEEKAVKGAGRIKN